MLNILVIIEIVKIPSSLFNNSFFYYYLYARHFKFSVKTVTNT